MSEQKAQMRRKRGWMTFRVAKIVDETADTKSFFLVDSLTHKREFDFVAGQYLSFRFDELALSEPPVRSYTISSTPECTDFVVVTIKKFDQGLVSQYLFEKLREGDCLRATGPIGDFSYNELSLEHLCMVGAGCGVTPFLSIGGHYASRLGSVLAPDKMTMLLAFRSKEDIIGASQLEEISRCQGVQLQIALSREDRRDEGYLYGRLNEKMLSDIADKPYGNTTTYMICGPADFMSMAKNCLLAREVPSEQIRMESF